MIDWLVRKPGAFANHRCHADLFPTSHFRIAYDALMAQEPRRGERQYLALLLIAARHGEQGVEAALRTLVAAQEPITIAAVEQMISTGEEAQRPAEVLVAPVDLTAYDALLMTGVAA